VTVASDQPTSPGTAASPVGQPRHLWRMVTIWLILSIVADVLFYILVGPHVPPGTMTTNASDNQFDFNILLVIALPVLIAVWVYLAYCMVTWRAGREGVQEPVGGPASRSHLGVQVGWIITTTVIVLGLFIFGTVRLITGVGSGGGEGPNPIWTPTSATVLPVQVIAQQWKFTYRYPTYGGVETPHLVLPIDQMVELHVTSLDVIHSFWALQLGVKADANPQVDNVAFVKPTRLESFEIRCAELCGIWHGNMFDRGRVVSQEEFATWIQQEQATFSDATKVLPPYSRTYLPEPTRRGG
jgi:cytochrome c oxidase subunit II